MMNNEMKFCAVSLRFVRLDVLVKFSLLPKCG